MDPADEQQERMLLEFWSNYLMHDEGKLGLRVIDDFCTFSVECLWSGIMNSTSHQKLAIK